MNQPMVQAASYPPLQRKQGRGTHRSRTGSENTKSRAHPPEICCPGHENVSFVHMVRPTICQKSQYQNTKVQCKKFQIEVYDPGLNYYKQGLAADSITSHSSDEQNPRDSTHKQ